MKWMLFVVFLLLAGSVYAEVESVSSGVFRGSMRHIVTISAEDTVSGVAAGDYLSFRFPGEKYLTATSAEELDIYIRRFDTAKEAVVYDAGLEKFRELAVGDEYALDVNEDGVDDVVLAFVSLDRRATFTIRDINAVPEEAIPDNLLDEPCDVACLRDDDCSTNEVCIYAGTCDAYCLFEEPEPVEPEAPVPEIEDVPEPVEKKGWFVRFMQWLARIF